MFKIDSNIAEVAGEVEQAARQLPFAMARGLTWTAMDARERVKQELPHRFTIRTPWTAKGVTITPAKKKDNPPTATIGSKDWYMREQEQGATRRPRKAKALAVPMRVRRTKTGKITKANKPRALLRKKKHFVNRTKEGDVILWKRKTKQSTPIIPLWQFVPKAQIVERWRLAETVGFVVDQRLPRNMRKSMRLALNTAR